MASLSLHIIGAPGAGKSTVFDALTMTPDGPSCVQKGGARIGSARVPDERLEKLRDLYQPKKYMPAETSFVDADHTQMSKGEASSFMADADAFVLVLQAYGEMDYEGRPVDPVRQMESVILETVVADLDKVERRLEREEKEKRAGRGLSEIEKRMLEKSLVRLEAGLSLRDVDWTPEETAAASHFQFLSRKPLLAVCNVDENRLDGSGLEEVTAACETADIEYMTLCAPLEAEIGRLSAEEQAEFLADYGQIEPASGRLIRAAYRLLDLIGFFTVGEDEVRAWTVRRGTTAQPAAGKIHTDLERGFIRAEVVPWDALLEAGSMSACKENGAFRLEGKDYIVQDGDVMHIRFNV